jgi:hypothetical protein
LSAETTRQKTVNRPAAVTPAAAAPVQVQTFSNKVSSPKDPAEKEAESTAKKVMRMAQPPSVARFAGSIQRKGEGQPGVSAGAAAEIRSSMAGGSPLPPGVRGFMEPRFRADFSNVKVHTGEKAARLSAGLNAQAFTVGNHVFFGRDRFRPESGEGRELIAHELTHTIQQGSVIQRSEDVSVTQSSPAQVQRLGVSDALDYFADKANLIPGFRMFTIVLGVNPINMSRVERSAANILRAAVEFIPGGALITRALDNYGVFDRVGNWVEEQIRSLGMTGAAIRQAVMEFIDSLSWTDIFDLGGVWERAKRIFSVPIDRIRDFLVSLGSGILRFIREAILRPLGALAARTPAWDLLKAVLGQDPITGDPYPRNADTLIGGFMKLIGQEEVWNNLKRANAVARAWAWFQSAINELIGFVREIPGLFLQALQALQIDDLVDLPGAFARVGRVFSNFVGRFVSWGFSKVLNLLEIIFEVLAPAVVPYLRKAAGAFSTIIQNPIGFIGNLVRAGLQGFRQFAANFLTHLRASLVAWLTGTLSGANIYIPQAFTLREIIKFVLSVLGLTWQNIRQKLVRAVGETAVRALETGFDIVMTLVTQGPAAAWEKIQESLSNLRDMVMEQIMTFVRERVVQAAITRLVTSLNPAGAFIQAIIAIYNTIMFFVERLRQIGQVAAAFIDSISAIASGVISAAANRVEQTMAGLLTLVISFLARIAGLGRVSDAVINIVNRVRAPIDRALDRVVDWIVAQARRLGRLVVSGVQSIVQWWRMRQQFRAADGETHTLYFEGSESNPVLMIASTPTRYENFVSGLRGGAAALGTARQLDAVKARPASAFTAPNTKDVVVGRLFGLLVTQTGPLLVAAGPGANAYPGSGLDPLTRTNLQLWMEILPDPIAGHSETPTDIARRRIMARGVLLQRYTGGPRNVAQAIMDLNLGRNIKAFDAQTNGPGDHLLDKHVLNGSGMIGDARALALRALLDPITAGTASAYLSVSTASSAIRGAIVSQMGSMGGWPQFREHIINNSGSNVMPASASASARVRILRSTVGSPPVPMTVLPVYLNIAGATGTRPLYPGDRTSGTSGAPLTTDLPFSGNIHIVMLANGSKPGGWFVLTSFPLP